MSKKIVYTFGCTVTGIDVDDKPIDDLTVEEKKEILLNLIEKCDSQYYDDIIQEIVELSGEYKYIGHCDTCGDSIVEYSMELEI